MYVEEYGKDNKSVIVMLHGANFVHCFGRQYSLAEKYHIVVPHIMALVMKLTEYLMLMYVFMKLLNTLKLLTRKFF